MANLVTWLGTPVHPGDTVRVHYKLIEKEKTSGKGKREVKETTRERTQPYEGIVLAIKGSVENCMITVRKIGAGGVGIERIFPLTSPWVKKVEVKKIATVRRAKLYYLRDKTAKETARISENVQVDRSASN